MKKMIFFRFIGSVSAAGNNNCECGQSGLVGGQNR